jgi:hypothetical protein
MRTRLAVIGLTAALGLGALAGCGSTSKGTKSTSSVPDARLSASTAPPRLGYYAGVECMGAAELCDAVTTHSLEGYTAFCRGGRPNLSGPSDFTYHGQTYNYVCFTLRTSNGLADFYFADAKIVRNVHVSADRFPETCDNGYCISGEWFSTTTMKGKIRNPNGVRSDYRAKWIAASS